MKICFQDLEFSSLDESLETKILEILEGDTTHYFVLLTFKEYLSATHSKRKLKELREASLLFTSSHLLSKGYSWLFGKEVAVTDSFYLTLSILRILEKYNKSIYLLGETVNNMQRAERNLTRSYPKLNFWGRHSGYFHKDQLEDLLTTINKLKPDLLLLGKSSRLKGNRWINEACDKLKVKLAFFDPRVFRIFIGSKRKPINQPFVKFLVSVAKTIYMPWRIFYLIELISYGTSLLVSKSRLRRLAKENLEESTD